MVDAAGPGPQARKAPSRDEGTTPHSSLREQAPERPPAKDYDLPDSPACAFCGGTDTELHSPFGSALSVATYWCNGCRTAFEWVKWGPERVPSDGT